MLMNSYNFVLIIPTHNRHDYLHRITEYFKDVKAHVVICDSTRAKCETKFPDNITYKHLPDKKFAEKILYAIDNFNSEMYGLCADDDFIVLESLYEGSLTLEKEKRFQTVLGRNLLFNENFDGKYYNATRFMHDDIDFGSRKNVAVFFNNYQQVLWGIYTKQVLKKSFEIIQKAELKNDNFIEFVLGAVACHLGGIKFLSKIWSVREFTERDHWGKRHNPIHHIYTDSVIKKDFRSVQELLDEFAFSGFSKQVLNTYLGMSEFEVFKQRIKHILQFIFGRFMKAGKPVERGSLASVMERFPQFEPTKNQQIQLDSISKILTTSSYLHEK